MNATQRGISPLASEKATSSEKLVRTGFTLLELVIGIGIAATLLSLFIPAIQSGRESSRRAQCANNLRNIALASLQFEVVHRELPGMYFDGHPSVDLERYSTDRGLFVEILPFIEQNALFGKLDRSSPIGSPTNSALLEKRPSVLGCPSSGTPSIVSGLPHMLNRAPDPTRSTEVADYAGNGGGWFATDRYHYGAIRVGIGTKLGRRRLSQIQDGLANTLFYWESSGSDLFLPSSKQPLNYDTDTRDRLQLQIDEPGVDDRSTNMTHALTPIFIINKGSVKLYYHGWPGFNTGSAFTYDDKGQFFYSEDEGRNGRIINIANDYRQPFSHHPGGVHVAFVDGSIQFLIENIDNKVFAASVSAFRGELNATQ